MFSLILHAVRGWRPVLLGLGLLTISAGAMLVIAVAQTTLIVADRELSNYWRTSYDILVRPAGSRSPIEEKYGLVEANHLSGLWGGITFEQYEAIKSIPDIEVAAPIAMIGYVPQFIQTDNLGELSDPGVFVVENTMRIDDGANVREYYGRTYYYVGPENFFDASPEEVALWSQIIVNPDPPEIYGSANISYLLAGMDPSQEAALAGLDQALTEGQYLKGDEALIPRPYQFPAFPGEEPPPETLISVPSLINVTPYVHMDLRFELKRLLLPSEDLTLKEITARGGTEYLATLPAEVLGANEFGSEALYRRFLVEIQHGGMGVGYTLESAPSPIIYREAPFPFSYQGLTLDIVLPERKEFTFLGETEYRLCLDPRDKETRLNAAFTVNVKGVFNIERLPESADINRVPLETYFPPIAILRYDEQGQPVEPRTLRPTRSTCGYIQSPPLILTTLEAARALRGEEAVSAIRVRVSLEGCPTDQPETCTLTPAAQRKIEAIAIEIQRQTGLDVDIMVGSSPTRVLVHVPGIGYVEEQWIQKNVTFTYRQKMQSGYLLLLGALLGIGGLFTLDLAWAKVVARQRIIALQKALGWRSRTVFAQVLGQVLWVSLAATLAGTLGAWGLIRLLGWQPLSLELFVAIPLAMIALCALGSLYPAWLASRLPPIAVLQHSGLRYRIAHDGWRGPNGLLSYAWQGLMRRRSRTALSGLSAALSSALLMLLLAVTLERQGALSGTLLGEFILVHIEGFHYALVGLGFGLAALSIANSLLASVLERQAEIGVLKAVGWHTGTVVWLFVLEGLLIGLLGGAVGVLLGSGVFLGLYRSLTPALAGVVALSVAVPGLVGALAALYPARVAARVLPAEAVRYE